MSTTTSTRPSATALQPGDRIIERDITGTVKFYNKQKGFGFIRCEDGREIFVHHTGLATKGFQELQENQRVQFDVAHGNRGLKAINVSQE